jgi:hypothetical protein
MDSPHLSASASPPARRAYFLETAEPPAPNAPRNSGRNDDPATRAFVISLWESAISEIPTVFGRLVFLAGLRDTASREYRHYGLELPLGIDASAVIRETHGQAFLDWLSLTVERQKADLETYLASVPGHRRQALDVWSEVGRHATLFPDSASPYELRLYLAEMRVLLGLFKGAAAPEPGVRRLAENEA